MHTDIFKDGGKDLIWAQACKDMGDHCQCIIKSKLKGSMVLYVNQFIINRDFP